MAISKEELKRRACEAIDKNRDKIIELGDSIFAEPELGFKEFKTAEKIKKVFDELNCEYRDGVAVTGVIAQLKGKSSKTKIAIMGELDAVVAPGHRCADPNTGAAHACGHNAMIASLAGAAYALKGTGIMEELDGDIALMAVPAEEYVEIEYRNNLREQGKIHFLGGKQEFIRLGEMNDIDIMVMQHTLNNDMKNINAIAHIEMNGFVGKLVRYIGKEAHAGVAPHLGINALNAASLGLQAVAMQRETFQEKDQIRVHPIITKGGDLVNVVPADVRIETYIRGNNIEAIMDANEKVTRAFKAGGDAIGAQTIITDLPGYLPLETCEELTNIAYDNLNQLLPKETVLKQAPRLTGSTDAGDVSHLIPCLHSYFLAAEGALHSEKFELVDKELSYITTAKSLAMTAIDLLYNNAELAQKVKESYKPKMTKKQYLKEWGKIDI